KAPIHGPRSARAALGRLTRRLPSDHSGAGRPHDPQSRRRAAERVTAEVTARWLQCSLTAEVTARWLQCSLTAEVTAGRFEPTGPMGYGCVRDGAGLLGL